MPLTVISLTSEGGADTLRDIALRIELSNGSLFSFKDCYLSGPCIAGGYAAGREINADEEEAFRFASACLRAEKRALRLIARAEQSVFGLSRKLKKRGHDSDCIRAVTARLGELGLLDDGRYARLWLESRISRQASSPIRLLAALRSRGIGRHDAEAALRETLDSEAERQLLERYAQKWRRRRLTGFGEEAASDQSLSFTLKSEGFSSGAIALFLEQ